MTHFFRPPRRWLVGLAASLPLMIGACDSAEVVASELEGVWQSRGYGRLVQITGDKVRWIERTEASCLPTDNSSIGALKTALVDEPDLVSGTFTVGSRATLSTVTFDRLNDEAFGKACPDGLTERTDDPELNFEVLWQTFDQHYAFFDERNVDWDAVYNEFRPRITKETTSRELRQMLGGMLERLGDAHVSLYADGDDVVSVGTRLGARLRNECRQEQGAGCNVYRYRGDQYARIERLQKEAYLKGQFKTDMAGEAFWGQIDAETGYFRIDSMEGLAARGYTASSDLAALELALDNMLADIGDLPAMIVDARLNGGGHDTVAVAIANRFTDERRVFGSKRAYFDGEQLASTELVVDLSEGQRYDGDVVLLTSSETASAAEIFTMAMRVLPKVTLIGTATEGILSDELYRTLPNGWEFSLSNEIYLTHDGALFEASGVPPEIEATFLLADDLENGVDLGIETALTFLAKKTGTKGKSH